MLIISGHYDGGHEFFSEHVEASEFLPVAEMERASCGGSCGGLFSRLKEVYLFGCNTLNPEARRSVSANVVSSLVEGGLSRPEAEQLVRSVNARYGESSRDRMRLVFKDVPVIYGFSSVAPGLLARGGKKRAQRSLFFTSAVRVGDQAKANVRLRPPCLVRAAHAASLRAE